MALAHISHIAPISRSRSPLAIQAGARVVEAGLHTIGSMSPPPDDPAILAVWTAMQELRLPLGLGMAPSVLDIQRSLALTMTVLLLLMAAMGLVLPAAAAGNGRVIRLTPGLLCAANLALLGLWLYYRVPPPLLFQIVLTPFLLYGTFGPEPRVAVGTA